MPTLSTLLLVQTSDAEFGMTDRGSRPPMQRERERRGSWWQPPVEDGDVETPEFDDESQPWVPLPPASSVWFVAENRRGPTVTAMRMRPPGQPAEVLTRLGAVIRLGPDVELVVGKWSIGHDWR